MAGAKRPYGRTVIVDGHRDVIEVSQIANPLGLEQSTCLLRVGLNNVAGLLFHARSELMTCVEVLAGGDGRLGRSCGAMASGFSGGVGSSRKSRLSGSTNCANLRASRVLYFQWQSTARSILSPIAFRMVSRMRNHCCISSLVTERFHNSRRYL
jgi:hypothetical protein